jgi:hypothetical protein
VAQEGKLTPNLSRSQLLNSLNEIFTTENSAKVGWLEQISRFFEKK